MKINANKTVKKYLEYTTNSVKKARMYKFDEYWKERNWSFLKTVQPGIF